MDSPPSKRFRAAETPATQDDAGRLWWCRECAHPAFSVCMDSHDVSRPKVALRRGLKELKTESEHARSSVWDEADPDEPLEEQNVLTALRLFRGAPTTCKLTVQQDGSEDLSVEWRLDGQICETLTRPYSLARSLLKPAVVILAARGELKPEPAIAEETPSKGAEDGDTPSEAEDDETPSEGAEDGQTQSANELDLSRLRRKCPTDTILPYHAHLAGMLRRVRDNGLRRLTELYCSRSLECAWALKLLQNAAPTLEDLELYEPLKEHIYTFALMPRLRRLAIKEGLRNPDWVAPEVSALPPLPHPSCLQSLRLDFMPDITVRELLRTFEASLVELRLTFSEGLVAILEESYLLPCLSKLVLLRGDDHTVESCTTQLTALRSVLPACNVLCGSNECIRRAAAAKSGNASLLP